MDTPDARLADLIDDFAFLDDWEDRYLHVIDLGKSLQPLTDEERNTANKVQGCASQVWIVTEPREGRSRGVDVPAMRRIEGPAQEADGLPRQGEGQISAHRGRS